MPRALLLLVVLGLTSCAAAQAPATLGLIDANAAAGNAGEQDRKVIVEATIKLAVANLSDLEREIPRLTKERGGYLASAAIDRTRGMYVTGRWIARVPVGQFESFLAAITKLGVAETFDQQTQDVTEEFVDLKTRIANEKQLETRVLELLTKTSDEIKEVIEVERELARVRGEIEKMEGRLKFLANRTEFTTVTIEAVERQEYVPPQAPTFSGRIAQAWWASLKMLQNFGETAIVSVVFLSPWLLPIPLIVLVGRWTIHRRRKR